MSIKQNNNYDIFISYASEDQEIVDDLYDKLNSFDYEIFTFIHEKEPGISIPNKIFTSLNKSKIFMPVITKISMKKQWVISECDYAILRLQEKKIKLLPIFAEKGKFKTIPVLKPYEHSKYHDRDFFFKLIEAIDKKLEKKKTNTNILFNKLGSSNIPGLYNKDTEVKIINDGPTIICVVYIHNPLKKNNSIKCLELQEFVKEMPFDFIVILSEYSIEGVDDSTSLYSGYPDGFFAETIAINLFNKKTLKEKREILVNAVSQISQGIQDQIAADMDTCDDWKSKNL